MSEVQGENAPLTPVDEVLAIRYASIIRPTFEVFSDAAGDDTPMGMDYFFWVIRTGGRAIVVDTGCPPETCRARGRTVTLPVAEGLALAGVDPDSVSDVIMTHLHWDHAGSSSLFPAAQFHLQAAELEHVTSAAMDDPAHRAIFDEGDASAFAALAAAGRVSFSHERTQIAPGVVVHRIGGHTPGSQVVQAQTARGRLVLLSDAAHYYANFEQRRPFSVQYDQGALLEAYDRLPVLADGPDGLIPGHDPLVLERYPSASAAAAGHIARLDLAPRSRPAA